MKFKHAKLLFTMVGILFLVLSIVWIRALWGSKQAYEKGRSFLAKKQKIEAITFFDRSIHWYAPLNPYVWQSAKSLWQMAERAEDQNNIELALLSLRSIRRGMYAAKSFYLPGKDWIKRCDEKITTLINKGGKQALSDNKSDGFPDTHWTLVLEIGFFGWIGTTITFLILAQRDTGKRPPTLRVLISVALFLVFFTLWILGMIKA